ncbi:putative endonuclease [Marinicella litoralis]|uniref:Putative endonuclease n=2 Tax=Marinicella litoralis TaxID=644220 RepID=A0A4R6XRD7_9GAMM|nr:putative endonuclease [Marinicella litoralis]
MEMKNPAVYILTNQRNGTLYIGVTSDLIQRIYQHKSNAVEGFSKKYQTHMLVYFEQHPTMESALLREKQMKEWKRAWKINLIEKLNPFWKDLYQDII